VEQKATNGLFATLSIVALVQMALLLYIGAVLRTKRGQIEQPSGWIYPQDITHYTKEERME
jgi:hypothetical protein